MRAWLKGIAFVATLAAAAVMAQTNGHRAEIVATMSGVSAAPSPTPAPGYSAWLDASDVSTMFQDAAGTVPVTTDGQNVRSWGSKGGSSTEPPVFAQAAGSVFATYETGVVNGRPVVRSSSSRDGVMTDDVGLGDIGVVSLYDYTIFSVVRFDAIAGGAVFGTAAAIGAQLQAGPLLFHYSEVGALASIATDVSGQWVVITSMVVGPAPGNGYIGFNDTRTASLGTSGGWGGWTLSRPGQLMNALNARPLNGDLAEIIFYPTALSESERKVTEQYLADKYGISLPY